ncbi:hypothetical protein KSP40_PGU019841 [Platanthera guangdongensis]|uniref:O-fucosyltransferase family protein n=1 Tax=Platanthera guangdongensis TaxID=2320717 RepID=A0ABR2M1Z8_9ASPA
MVGIRRLDAEVNGVMIGVDGVMNNVSSEVLQEVTHNAIFHVPNEGGKPKYDLWNSKLSMYYYGCSNASNKFAGAQVTTLPNRYLMIATSGGLNQQRTGITDAVVAAHILNATLVVPKLDQRSFWKDSSDFTEIFDVDWFISYLSRDVKIIKQLPRKGGGKVILMAVDALSGKILLNTATLYVLLTREI